MRNVPQPTNAVNRGVQGSVGQSVSQSGISRAESPRLSHGASTRNIHVPSAR